MLLARAAAGKPLRVGLIGAGKFGSMYLAQAKHTPGVHVAGIADLAPDRARATPARAAAQRHGTTCVIDDAEALIGAPEVDIIIEATGNPAAGIRHALACCAHR